MRWVDYAYGWPVEAADEIPRPGDRGGLVWLRFDVPPDVLIRRVQLHRVAGVPHLLSYALALRVSDGAGTWRYTLPGRSLRNMFSPNYPSWWRYLVPQLRFQGQMRPSRAWLAEQVAFAGLESLEVLVGIDVDGAALPSGSPSHPSCTIAFESCRLADAPEASWQDGPIRLPVAPPIGGDPTRRIDPVRAVITIRAARMVRHG